MNPGGIMCRLQATRRVQIILLETTARRDDAMIHNGDNVQAGSKIQKRQKWVMGGGEHDGVKMDLPEMAGR